MTDLIDDQKRVFDFFNEGQPAELAAIQGCSKKKVESILELRPYTSWQDLVKKCQMSRQLNTEMLNNTTDLLKMRDGIARYMKCLFNLKNKSHAATAKGTPKVSSRPLAAL